MDVKKNVLKTYDAIAAEPTSCCCPQTPEATQRMGYAGEDVEAVPDGAYLGLGCYNPLPADEDLTGQTILDLGAGPGGDCLLAARRVGPTGKVIGVDMAPNMIGRARANAQVAGLDNVEFRLGEIERLPLADASIDLVISNCVINLCPDKAAVFREAARVLRRGGRMIVADTVLLRPLPEWVRDSYELHACCIAGAVPLEKYAALIKAAGLADVRVVARREDLPAVDMAELAGHATESLRGLVASITFSACKPVR